MLVGVVLMREVDFVDSGLQDEGGDAAGVGVVCEHGRRLVGYLHLHSLYRGSRLGVDGLYRHLSNDVRISDRRYHPGYRHV